MGTTTRRPTELRSAGGPCNRWLATVVVLLVFGLVASPLLAVRKTINRRFPSNGDMRPAGPYDDHGSLADAVVFVAPADGAAEITIRPATCQPGFRIDNVLVLKTTDFLASNCGAAGNEPCSVVDVDGGCYNSNQPPFNTVRALAFDLASPPSNLVLFETFENGIPESWPVDGATWDGSFTAPTAVPNPNPGASDEERVCHPSSQGGSLALETGSSVTIPLTGLAPGEEYLVQIWWGSRTDMVGGEVEKLYVDVPGTGPPPAPVQRPLLLLDDDDDHPDVRLAYEDALFANGIFDFDVRTTDNSDVEPSPQELSCYGTVIWFSGDASGSFGQGVAGPGAQGEAALSAFLDAGGCLLLSSQEYLWDHGLTMFMEQRLGLEDGGDAGQSSVTGGGPFTGIGPSTLEPSAFPDFLDYPDALIPSTAEVAFQGDQGIAAIAREDDVSRAAFLGFAPETMPVEDFEDAIQAFLAWCDRSTLTVGKSGNGSGKVTGSLDRIDCGDVCSETFFTGTEITLSATADPGSTFIGWIGGGCFIGSRPCTLTLNDDTQVTAVFELDLPDPTLSVNKSGDGTGRVTSSPAGIDCGSDCSEQYPGSTQITLTATADLGSTFSGWNGDGCSGTGACTLTLNTDTQVTATFDLDLPDPLLSVSKAGDGTGRVTSSPAGIDCGSDCSQRFAAGTPVVLFATTTAGSTFSGWSGGGCTGNGACTVTVDTDTAVVATFAAEQDDCPAALCLRDGRFLVDVVWRNFQGEIGTAQLVPGIVSEESGVLYFFAESNWEMLIKVLDGCGVTGHFWVFAAATTNAGYTLTVRDTLTGAEQQYYNPLGRASPAITDTTALPCNAGNATPGTPPAAEDR